MSIIKRCEHLCDTSVRLESFAGSEKETGAVYRDYHGLFHVNKLPAINTLTSHVPESFDLAFKLRRKKFVIEVGGVSFNKFQTSLKLFVLSLILFS